MNRWLVLTLMLSGCAREGMPVARDAASLHGSPSDHDDDHDDDHDESVASDPATVARSRLVLVVPQNSAGCESEVLGLVDVHKGQRTEEQALDVLKRKAASIGAEKVIGVEFHHGEAGAEPTHLSGVAVRCHDFLQGRRYEVIGQIDVSGKMRREEDALSELKARARALHADLILGVKFEHGEGEGAPTRVTGTAIRFARDGETRRGDGTAEQRQAP
jgi:uncharacterized protein YbjQ (UPF0145 family)